MCASVDSQMRADAIGSLMVIAVLRHIPWFQVELAKVSLAKTLLLQGLSHSQYSPRGLKISPKTFMHKRTRGRI